MAESPHIRNVTTEDFDGVVIEGSRQRPVLVDFWADWCGPCHMLMPVLARLAEEYQGAFLLAKVDTEAQRELAQRYGIRSLPTVKLFRDGQAVDELMGVQPEAVIRQLIDRYAVKESDRVRERAVQAHAGGDTEEAMRLLRQALDMDPRHVGARLDLAKLIGMQGHIEEALSTLDQVPVESADDAAVRQLRGQLGFAKLAAEAPASAELERHIADRPDDPAPRYRLAARRVVEGDFEGALEQLMVLVLRHRDFEDDAGRKAILAVFDILGGDHPLVKRYRSRMFAALH